MTLVVQCTSLCSWKRASGPCVVVGGRLSGGKGEGVPVWIQTTAVALYAVQYIPSKDTGHAPAPAPPLGTIARAYPVLRSA